MTHGYYREYYIGLKYIGYILCDKDRVVLGYYGRTKETLLEDVVLTNKKKIKKGTEVITQLQKLL